MPHYTPIDITIAVIAIVVLPVISAWNGRLLARANGEHHPLTGRYWWVLLRSGALILLVIIAWLRLGRPFSALGLELPIAIRGLVGFGIDVALAANILHMILFRRLSAAQLDSVRQRFRRMQGGRILPQTRGEHLLFIAMAIIGSTCEELVYRGFLIWFFSPMAGLVCAVLISSIAFGLAHAYLGRLAMVRTGGAGLVLGVAYVLSRSLWWLMLAHILLNLNSWALHWRSQRDLGAQPA